MSHIIRVDSEVYGNVIHTRALLEMATGHTVSLSGAILFIIKVREIGGAEA